MKNSFLDNNCDGSGPHRGPSIVRVFPLGGGANLILCLGCWEHENDYRRTRGRETKAAERWPVNNWNMGEIYASEHPKVSQNVIDVLSKDKWTGWGFTDCAAVECQKCGAPKYHYCVQPSGRKAWPPHNERYQALIATGYTANQRPGIAKTGLQIIAEIKAREKNHG